MRLLRGMLALALVSVGSAAARPADPPQQDPRRTPVVEVAQRCKDAVVNISTTRLIQSRGFGGLEDIFEGLPRRAARVQSVGSGVVVHESGYIVTNAHVVSQATDVQITFADKHTLPAEVIAVDQEHDLAVVKVNSPQPLAAQKLGRSDDIMIGETVVAIGNPLGLQHTVTTGIVSAVGRDLAFGEDVVYRGLIQTDAPINPGNSGGPLLNIKGELIGINSAIRGDAQNIGFAIPVDHLWELLPALLDIEGRQRVRFGLHVSGRDASVIDVRPESPAAQAGLRPADRIVEFNGQPLHDGIDYYVHLMAQKPDSEIKLKLRRGKEMLSVAVPLQSIPLPDGAKLARERLGVELTEIPEDLRRKYGLPQYVGLVVESVVRGSPAARKGIAASMFIVRLNGLPVVTLKDVGLVLEKTEPSDALLAEVLTVEGDFLVSHHVQLRGRGGR